MRPFTSVGGSDAYIGPFNKAAALFHSIINNHCFHNGNKRAALLTTLVYLGEEGWWVTIPNDDEMFEFTRKAAAHELTENRDDEINFISEWFSLMVLDAAKQGKGTNITSKIKGGKLDNPEFVGMEKWSYGEKSAGGLRSEVHYVRNPKTGELMDFKFKHHAETGR